ncbi:MAG: hypothetical protein ACM3SM_13765 [Bacteroidota bacterium]
MYKLLKPGIMMVCILQAGCGWTSYNFSYLKKKPAVSNARYYESRGIDSRIFGNWKLTERRELRGICDGPSYTIITTELELQSDETFDFRKMADAPTGPWSYFNEKFLISSEALVLNLRYKGKPYRDIYAYKVTGNELALERTAYDTIPGVKLPPSSAGQNVFK